MKQTTSLLVIALSSALVAACATDPSYDLPIPNWGKGSSGDGSAGGTATGGATSGGATTGGGAGMGLPCEVADVLAAQCDSCHGAGRTIQPILASYDDLMQPSSDPNLTMAEMSLQRMQDAGSPMPPAGAASAADVAVFEAWVVDGMPMGDCGGGGAGGGGPVDSRYDGPVVCTSGNTWNNGDNGGDRMFPGEACNDCHSREDKVIFDFAGTVYPTGHEPDKCYGVGAGDAVVEIEDDNGQVYQATTNETGNFRKTSINISYPAIARIIANGRTLTMATPLAGPADADCNSCHDQNGSNNAPGRLILP